jgi:hypothetical protein
MKGIRAQWFIVQPQDDDGAQPQQHGEADGRPFEHELHYPLGVHYGTLAQASAQVSDTTIVRGGQVRHAQV